jgi:hypothetical protein
VLLGVASVRGAQPRTPADPAQQDQGDAVFVLRKRAPHTRTAHTSYLSRFQVKRDHLNDVIHIICDALRDAGPNTLSAVGHYWDCRFPSAVPDAAVLKCPDVRAVASTTQ